jgi:hypothetical protein
MLPIKPCKTLSTWQATGMPVKRSRPISIGKQL